MQIKFFTSLIFAFLMGIFAIQNSQDVQVNFLFFKFHISMSILITAIIVIGYIICLGFSVFKEIKYKRIIKSKNKNIAKLKKEISVINGSTYGQKIHTGNNIAYENITKLLSIKVLEDDGTDQKTETQKSKILKTETQKLEEHISAKVQSKETANLDNILSGFDDLENDDFSLNKKNIKKDVPWHMEKSVKINKIDINRPQKCIDLKAEYSKYIKENNSDEKQNNDTIIKREKKVISPVKIKNKKFKKISSKHIRKINPEKTFLKLVLNDENLQKAVDEASKKSDTVNPDLPKINLSEKENITTETSETSSLTKLYKQNTSPENTLSRNLVQERFNWKSDTVQNDDMKETEQYNGIPISVLKNKINSLFSSSDLRANYKDNI
ncbi:LapA family protein [Peptoanaerobacter stomatis]